ncbi:MAG TPA: preprotein translocase subunit SecG [Flavobacteriales bacterium]|jgi:preprotein translocase subunit SecG|nr:preprotein translocase subunit SecG [Flavobacteriales bacterium]HIO16698.1 preprotein translocase subunit SecG [Flavobacteriales bacterium]HIO58570.1 preprotein translocase subunit SecG [Flavobacteriales bacterium]
MGTFLTVIILIICFLLGAVILVQNPKGGGLASGFTGGASMGGVQRTSDFLEKSTWYLVVALFVSCMFAGIYNGNRDANVGIDESFLPSTTAPAAPVSPAAVDAPPSAPAATEEVAE